MKLLINIIWIIVQLFLSVALYVPIYKFFEEKCTKGKPRNNDRYDVIAEDKMIAKIILLTGITLLGGTIVVHIFYRPFIGFYLSSFFFIYLGSGAIFYPKGRKITESCWVMPFQRGNFIVTLNDHKILIAGERLGGKPRQVIYSETSPKWLPPHENEEVLKTDYELILDAILKYLKNECEIRRPGEYTGPYLTKEDIILRFVKKGWSVENCQDGSPKVSPPKRMK